MNVRLNLIAIRTLVRKEMIRVLRIWVQTIVPPAITMTLYFIIFGNLIGRRIGQMDGIDYMAYIAPGLIMMSVITNSYGNVVSSFFGAKFGRHVEEMLVSPMSNFTMLLGYVIGGLMRGLIVGALPKISRMNLGYFSDKKGRIVTEMSLMRHEEDNFTLITAAAAQWHDFELLEFAMGSGKVLTFAGIVFV